MVKYTGLPDPMKLSKWKWYPSWDFVAVIADIDYCNLIREDYSWQ